MFSNMSPPPHPPPTLQSICASGRLHLQARQVIILTRLQMRTTDDLTHDLTQARQVIRAQSCCTNLGLCNRYAHVCNNHTGVAEDSTCNDTGIQWY